MGRNRLDLRQRQSGDRRAGEPMRGGFAAGTRRRRRRRMRRFSCLAKNAATAPRGNFVPSRRTPPNAQRRSRAMDHVGDGQSHDGSARRRAGSDRHGTLHGRRGAAHVWSHRAERAARQILHELARSDRRRRCHHAVEFPDCSAELENSARVRARQHGRVEAVERHARVRGEVRGSLC